VALPKRLWRMGSPQGELDRMYLLAYSVETALHDTHFKLEDSEAKVKKGGEGMQLISNIES
jgi:hypothetical protein